MNEQDLAQIIIGDSPAIQQVRSLVLRLAPTDLPVLIQGPTGSGKELVARALHQASGRRGKYVPFNVSAIADTLFEDTLFGHVKGAFTGAVRDAPGLLGEADRGTAFFDEIGELAYTLQPKLLRAIESRTYRPVGAPRDRQSCFRLVSATNRRLNILVEQDRFRADLAERLSTFVIDVPPLAVRRDDIPALVRHLAFQKPSREGREPLISEAAIRALQRYDWPNNVRELSNVVERALVLATGSVVRPADVVSAIELGRSVHPELDGRLESERLALVEVLESVDWDTAQAAEQIKVSRATIYRRMEKLGVRGRRG